MMHEKQGFTLIEVMVAMAITSVVAIMAYYGIDSAIRLSTSAEQQADELRQLNRAFDVIARDFRQVIGRTVRDPAGYDNESAFILDKSLDPFLRFSRVGWTNPEPARFQRSQLQRVNYRYEEEQLIRLSWQMMDRYEDSKEQAVVLLDGVEELDVRVLQAAELSGLENLGANVFVNIPQSQMESQWVEQWPMLNDTQQLQTTAATSVLPVAIELKLTLKRWGEIRRIFTFVDNSGDGQ